MGIKLTNAELRKMGIAPTKARMSPTPSAPPEGVIGLCRHLGIPAPQGEVVFDTQRNWRFDWAWTEEKVAIEVDGGLFAGKPCKACGRRGGGRHNRGKGMQGDWEKLNAAAIWGWRVLHCTPQEWDSGKGLQMVAKAIQGVN